MQFTSGWREEEEEEDEEEVTERFPVRAIPHFRSPQLISSIPASCYVCHYAESRRVDAEGTRRVRLHSDDAHIPLS